MPQICTLQTNSGLLHKGRLKCSHSCLLGSTKSFYFNIPPWHEIYYVKTWKGRVEIDCDQAEHSQINGHCKVHKKDNIFPFLGTITLHSAGAQINLPYVLPSGLWSYLDCRHIYLMNTKCLYSINVSWVPSLCLLCCGDYVMGSRNQSLFSWSLPL